MNLCSTYFRPILIRQTAFNMVAKGLCAVLYNSSKENDDCIVIVHKDSNFRSLEHVSVCEVC